MGTKKVRTSDVLHRLQQAEVLPAALLATIRRELSQSPASLSALKARLVAPDRLTEFQFQQAVHGGRLKLGAIRVESPPGPWRDGDRVSGLASAAESGCGTESASSGHLGERR
jgi:hypothetical protein